MERQYWATKRKTQIGPFATREEAVTAFRAANPFKGATYEARAPRNQFLTGYGALGPHFDIRFHSASGDAEAV